MEEKTAPSGSKSPKWFKISVLTFALCAVANTVRTRSISDFLIYSLYWFAPFVLILSPLELMPKKGRAEPLEKRAAGLVGLLIVAAILAPVLYCVSAFIKDVYIWVQSPSLSKRAAVIAGGALTAGLGGFLFYIRLKFRCVYGASEAVVGIIVATQRIAAESDAAIKEPAFYLAVLTAGVYLVVRGLDNIQQGLTREPFDPVVARLLRRNNRSSIVDVRL